MINKIISSLQKHPCLDNEDIRYVPEDYIFSEKEFCDFHNELRNRYFEEYAVKYCNYFPEYRMFFRCGKDRFIWRKLVGTGMQILKCGFADFEYVVEKEVVLENGQH